MRIACVGVWLGFALAANADIYRCVDPDGRVLFGDDPTRCDAPVVIELQRDDAACDVADCAPAAPSPGVRDALSGHFAASADLARGWAFEEEGTEAIDPELARLGLIDTATRHYSRSIAGASEVCTVELWRFVDNPSASRAARSVKMPHWRIDQIDALLVLTHGVQLALGNPARAGLFEACAQIGGLTREWIERRRSDETRPRRLGPPASIADR